MNIILQHIKFLLILVFLGGAIVAVAQPSSYENKKIPMNQEYIIEDIPNGIPNIPSLGNPDHGTLWIEIVGGDEHIHYLPDSNYIGPDTFYFQVFNPPVTNTFVGYAIQVSETLVLTKRDFASSIVNSSVTIYPLDNDSSTIGTLSLLDVSPIFNDGTVIISNGNEFEFTPNNGFKGITHMSYIGCNEFSACEKGIISVLVHDYALPSSQTTEILTGMEEAIPVLLPYPGYTINQSPSNGTIEILEDFSYLYTPNTGFSGQDNFSFSLNNTNGTSNYSVIAEVMDLPAQNNFSNDDYVYVSISSGHEIDVLTNDYGNLLEWTLTITSAPTNGMAWINGSGIINYIPNSNFEGVDQFTYKVANSLGIYETSTVYVTVSDFVPGSSVFDLDTYDDTPIYFEYKPPFSPYTPYYFKLINGPLYGTLILDSNSVNYIPVTGFVGTESFELEYCLKGNCFPFDINVNISANPNGVAGCVGTEDCVWAGDTNKDGIVDGKDILFLSAIGEVGAPRISPSSDWIGQHGTNWNNTVAGILQDVKHIDANGDSLITSADANIIDINYGKRNKITPQIIPTQQNQLIFNTINNGPPEPGDTIQIEILMGTPANPAIDFSGVTFQMAYNPIIFDTAFVAFDEGGWLGYDAPVMQFSKIPNEGNLDVAFTRSDETTKSGFGKIGTVSIVVDDIQGIRSDEFTTVSFTNSYSLTGNGHLTKLNDVEVQIEIDESDFNPDLRKNLLNVFPNPVIDGIVNLQTDYYNVIQHARVINLMGQIIQTREGNNTNKLTLDVSKLETGMYIMDVMTSEGPMTKKFEFFRR
ncbi:MAG: Ig-like domain-containing protein [Saprospiraceae bacterium]|nr:Ig-like domain-containing protein [Saprospiraceae bacterium]